jgi:hypothetical protein
MSSWYLLQEAKSRHIHDDTRKWNLQLTVPQWISSVLAVDGALVVKLVPTTGTTNVDLTRMATFVGLTKWVSVPQPLLC